MYLARVIGRLVSTRRAPGLEGVKLLLVRPVDEHGEDAGDTLVACDALHAGPGELVHVCDGREATLALPEPFVPVDATIVGHVEEFAHEHGLTGPTDGEEHAADAPARRRAVHRGRTAGAQATGAPDWDALSRRKGRAPARRASPESDGAPAPRRRPDPRPEEDLFP